MLANASICHSPFLSFAVRIFFASLVDDVRNPVLLYTELSLLIPPGFRLQVMPY